MDRNNVDLANSSRVCRMWRSPCGAAESRNDDILWVQFARRWRVAIAL
ncbi:hypothetical protein [Microbispora hainanensis]|nr:hypothetical protein [Microbispora hainanensis]